jgi:hypothetical protein
VALSLRFYDNPDISARMAKAVPALLDIALTLSSPPGWSGVFSVLYDTAVACFYLFSGEETFMLGCPYPDFHYLNDGLGFVMSSKYAVSAVTKAYPDVSSAIARSLFPNITGRRLNEENHRCHTYIRFAKRDLLAAERLVRDRTAGVAVRRAAFALAEKKLLQYQEGLAVDYAKYESAMSLPEISKRGAIAMEQQRVENDLISMRAIAGVNYEASELWRANQTSLLYFGNMERQVHVPAHGKGTRMDR